MSGRSFGGKNMELLDRFLSYVANATASDEASDTVPSTPGQRALAAQLAEDNVIRVVDTVRTKPERVKKKNAAAIYRYQADCDGAWGEIHFDFEKKQIHIKRLAEWDTTKSHIYAWKVICFIALSGELPEKKRIVFERE